MEILFPYQIIGQTIQSEIISYWRLCFIVIIVGFVWKKPKKRFSLFRDVKQNISLSLSLKMSNTTSLIPVPLHCDCDLIRHRCQSFVSSHTNTHSLSHQHYPYQWHIRSAIRIVFLLLSDPILSLFLNNKSKILKYWFKFVKQKKRLYVYLFKFLFKFWIE